MKEPTGDSFLNTAIFGHDDPLAGTEGDVTDCEPSLSSHLAVPEESHPMETFIQGLQYDAAVGKRAESNSDWDDPLYPSPRTFSTTFEARSAARLARVSERIRAMFGSEHAEEASEAIEVAKRMLAEARAEFAA